MDYRYGSHMVFKIQYHFVFVTKYRYLCPWVQGVERRRWFEGP